MLTIAQAVLNMCCNSVFAMQLHLLQCSYEQLVQLHPEVSDYQLYHAQCLYKACLFPEAIKASCQLEQETYQTKVVCVCV